MALIRCRACAVTRNNFPDRFKVQKPSHQKEYAQANTKTPQVHFHDSHKSRSESSNIRPIHTQQTINRDFTPGPDLDFPCAQTPVGHEAGVKTTALTQAWIFIHIFLFPVRTDTRWTRGRRQNDRINPGSTHTHTAY